MPSKLYAVRDCATGFYLPPVIGESDNGMIRSFGDAVTSGKDTPLAQHPEDYTLCLIGEFDRETGKLFSTDIVILAHGSDFVSRKESPNA